MHIEHIHNSYDHIFVFFSYVIAVFASYNVLNLAKTISSSRGKSYGLWLLYGAVVMGMGIWSMHFVGMLAVNFAIPVSYNFEIIIASVIVAIIASFIALYIVVHQKVSKRRLLAGASLFAIGISTMHYIGMEAVDLKVTYDPFYFILSIVIAFAASTTALGLTFYFLGNQKYRERGKKFGSALLMGTGIAGMHYTGMAGAHYEISLEREPAVMMIKEEWLAYFITIGSILTLALSLLGLYITRRFARQEMAKQESEKWYRSLYESNQDGIISVNSEHIIIGFNPAAEKIMKINEENYKCKPISSILPIFVSDQHEYLKDMYRRSSKGEILRYESAIHHHSGEQIDLSMVNTPVLVDGNVMGNYIIARDVTEEKRIKERNHFLAFHDELTGLPNRRMFNQDLSDMIIEQQESGNSFVVMVMDMDRFKVINDSLGHAYGDLFLQQMSKRIKQCLAGESAVISRMGGDEFAILLKEVRNEEEAVLLAERIIKEMGLPYQLKDNEYYVTASIGIAIYPQHGIDAVQLQRNADMAMYEVKKQGKNNFHFFSNELNAQITERVELEGELRKSIEREEFELYYQPQFHAGEGKLIGVEALVRWNHPEKGILSPALFIPVAEEIGLITNLGTWVLREACRQMHKWHEEGGPLIPVSVNLSSQQFYQPHLARDIKKILEETGLQPAYLELEITESMMMDAETSSEILEELSSLGIRISLDDFGTGYSSLSYLKMFPINKLKIDRSFIQDIAVSDNDKAIVASIISMAQHLKMDVIAEGIETKDQLDILVASNCSEIQGYYYSRPLPAGELASTFLSPLHK
ncbi:bifunctional diguanylate cyclase/phosphodiesterase [Paenibacillus sp. An7]|uniref:bifunctional diguanylate cyclase/phosphodiesterase n=1 Tax=Paenibacillus sp. An7 TaxID=2689577 RepID=UPI00135A72D4|nr:EAL domain-containing protein [Paenibacillus sp. An7]